MFQPRAKGGREQRADACPSELKLCLVLALPPNAFGGEQRADHGAAGPLDRREAIARAGSKQDW